MRPGVVAVLLTAALAVPALAGQFVEAPQVEVRSDGAVIVRWTTSPPVAGRVEYGPFEAFPQAWMPAAIAPAPVVAAERQTFEVRLEGLTPGTRYAYQVVLTEGAAEARSAIGEFTLPPAGSGLPDKEASASSNQFCDWLARLPVPVPQEPILLASVAFLTLFAVLLLLFAGPR